MSINPSLLEEFRRQRSSNTLRPDFKQATETRFRTWDQDDAPSRFSARAPSTPKEPLVASAGESDEEMALRDQRSRGVRPGGSRRLSIAEAWNAAEREIDRETLANSRDHAERAGAEERSPAKLTSPELREISAAWEESQQLLAMSDQPQPARAPGSTGGRSSRPKLEFREHPGIVETALKARDKKSLLECWDEWRVLSVGIRWRKSPCGSPARAASPARATSPARAASPASRSPSTVWAASDEARVQEIRNRLLAMRPTTDSPPEVEQAAPAPLPSTVKAAVPEASDPAPPPLAHVPDAPGDEPERSGGSTGQSMLLGSVVLAVLSAGYAKFSEVMISKQKADLIRILADEASSTRADPEALAWSEAGAVLLLGLAMAFALHFLVVLVSWSSAGSQVLKLLGRSEAAMLHAASLAQQPPAQEVAAPTSQQPAAAPDLLSSAIEMRSLAEQLRAQGMGIPAEHLNMVGAGLEEVADLKVKADLSQAITDMMTQLNYTKQQLSSTVQARRREAWEVKLMDLVSEDLPEQHRPAQAICAPPRAIQGSSAPQSALQGSDVDWIDGLSEIGRTLVDNHGLHSHGTQPAPLSERQLAAIGRRVVEVSQSPPRGADSPESLVRGELKAASKTPPGSQGSSPEQLLGALGAQLQEQLKAGIVQAQLQAVVSQEVQQGIKSGLDARLNMGSPNEPQENSPVPAVQLEDLISVVAQNDMHWKAQTKRAWDRVLTQRGLISAALEPLELRIAEGVVRRFGTGSQPGQKEKIRNWSLEYSYPEMLDVAEQEYSTGVIEYVNLSIDLLNIWQGDAQH